MAFWKKSEDPWDMKPKPVRTVSSAAPEGDEEPESLLDSVRDWAEKKRSAEKSQLTLPVEKCPWCGGEMEQGFLSGGRGVYWTRGVPDTKTKWLGAGMENQLRVDEEGALFTYRTAWLCPTCRKLAADLSDASDTPEGRTQEEYIEELRGYAEQAKQREEEN
ncbi:PF20097 family protein [Dysosmobacter sp.]|uniref:PF20097 family protein n=1 Tax=Dysosmobacter sp. TaxID=2591382 RepID=UPI002A8DC4B8|nr:PF20097 family protein [Dysosmobacter sp.]MDY3983923.1 PF20097 family protein [Dysosmobacter sp.]